MAAVKSYVDVLISPSMQNYISTNTTVGVWWHEFNEIFWTTEFWLPKDVDWRDLQPTRDQKYPAFHDIFVYPLMLSIAIMIIKHFFMDPSILSPLARLAGIANKRTKPPIHNKLLENLFQSFGDKPPHDIIVKAATETDISVRGIERWLRRRHIVTLCTKYDKFLDCGFHFIAHTLMFVYGFAIMYNKPWLSDIHLSWENYPFHFIDADVWWYYMLCLAYYWASTFMHIFSTGGKMSGSTQMLFHHFFTILLMVFSWACNFVRIGTLVLMVHECVDVPLLSAKMYKYAGFEAPTDALFTVFFIMWIYTRCYLYPFWIMHSVFIEATNIMGIPSVVLFKLLLIGLLILNIVWTVLIFGIIIKKYTGGSLEDIRSDAEEVSEEEDDDVLTKKND
ncbi:Ceramide synthase 5 [Halocaridina rubra]|uniref:Ceramide synthase 5 n=1 Tax=Halocaridina rubra TaxID=373956 RepID=A0AAN8XBN4_HALRR